MASFDQVQGKTAGKMSDLVMEYVSQFIARDYVEAYENVMNEERYEFVPADFDDKIYKKFSKLIRKKTGSNKKAFRRVLYFIGALVCVACIAFTIFVLQNDPMRIEILSMFGINW